jgi:hypothetical protein
MGVRRVKRSRGLKGTDRRAERRTQRQLPEQGESQRLRYLDRRAERLNTSKYQWHITRCALESLCLASLKPNHPRARRDKMRNAKHLAPIRSGGGPHGICIGQGERASTLEQRYARASLPDVRGVRDTNSGTGHRFPRILPLVLRHADSGGIDYVPEGRANPTRPRSALRA